MTTAETAPRPNRRAANTPGRATDDQRTSHVARRRAYRRDLDGLRGLAIALVVVFHIWSGRVSGGVDVFLALSGFFFGGMLLRDAVTSTLSPAAVVGRLIRRLMPALVTVLAGTAVLTVLIQPQTRWEAFANQSLASLGHFQNWELARTAADYLRAGEAVSPLQHIWSMSVQGQFYLALLVAVVACCHLIRRRSTSHVYAALVVTVSATALASFVYATMAHQADQSAAYYHSFARAWELLLGVLAAVLLPRMRGPKWLRAGSGGIALAAIICCGALIEGAAEFPGPWTLVPVGSTLMLIFAGAGGQLPLPNRILAARPLVATGELAYALYLWHWPLLILWLVHSDRDHAGLVDGAAVLVVSSALAVLTKRFIEDPLRNRRIGAIRRPNQPRVAIACAVSLLAVSVTVSSLAWRQYLAAVRANGTDLLTLSTQEYPGARALIDGVRVHPLPVRPTVLEASSDLPATTTAGCISDFGNAELITCTYGDQAAARSIALAGGSHAEHWITALDLLGRQHHFKVVTYLKMGCPLSTGQSISDESSPSPYPECRQWLDYVMPRLIADRPDFVFTTTTRPRSAPGDEVPTNYVGVWETLSSNGIAILGMRDTPWLVHDGQPTAAADCLARGGDANSCGMPRSEVLADRNPTLDYTLQYPLLIPLDMSDALCRTEICRVIEGNVLIYHDSHHLAGTYVRTMVPELGRQMAAATGWWSAPSTPRGHQ